VLATNHSSLLQTDLEKKFSFNYGATFWGPLQADKSPNAMKVFSHGSCLKSFGTLIPTKKRQTLSFSQLLRLCVHYLDKIKTADLTEVTLALFCLGFALHPCVIKERLSFLQRHW
jgi:hypothetical protein